MDYGTIPDWLLVALVAILVYVDMANKNERKEIALLREIKDILLEILRFDRASKQLVLKILVEGQLLGNPVTLGAKGGVCTEQDGSGNPYKPAGTLVFASDNTAVLTVDQSGNVAVASGAASGQSANISVLDQGNNLTDSVLCTLAIVAGKLVLVVTPN